MKATLLICLCFILMFLCIIILTEKLENYDAKIEYRVIEKEIAPAATPDREEEISYEERIWNEIRSYVPTDVAAAAIMGNLKYESNLITFRYENDMEPPYTYSRNYFEKHKVSKTKFMYVDGGFGLAGWTGITNLEYLYDFCMLNDYELDSMEGQIDFLFHNVYQYYPQLGLRWEIYTPADLVIATEDFRQTYEKSIRTEYCQYHRARFAKLFYLKYADDTWENKLMVAELPYNFEISVFIGNLMARLEQ